MTYEQKLRAGLRALTDQWNVDASERLELDDDVRRAETLAGCALAVDTLLLQTRAPEPELLELQTMEPAKIDDVKMIVLFVVRLLAEIFTEANLSTRVNGVLMVAFSELAIGSGSEQLMRERVQSLIRYLDRNSDTIVQAWSLTDRPGIAPMKES